MKLVFATGNSHKLQEAQEILGPGFTLVSPASLGLTEEIPETGTTLEANSLEKADYIYKHLGTDCFADDSGLEVDALNGAPGVYTARYADGEPQYKDNLEKLLHVLKDVPWEKRTARFRAVVTLIVGNANEIPDQVGNDDACSVMPGLTGHLVPNTQGIANAELPEGGKNAISHRGQCMRAMAEYLKSRK